MMPTAPNQAELIAELSRRVRAMRGLLPFTQYTFPEYETNWHHTLIAMYLDNVRRREIKRLMIFTPPRHGKSELVSFRFPAFVLGNDPSSRVLSCSYNDDLATKAGREVRRIMKSEEFGRLFPKVWDAINTRKDGYSNTSNEFELPNFRGGYKCAGVGVGITGRGFNIGIIDDPIKDRAEAESIAYRDGVWDWYTSTFFTRRDRMDSAIVLIQTRWHHDDLAGRLLTQMKEGGEQWVVLNLPALSEETDHSPEDPRKPGEALWPARFDRDSLLTLRKMSLYDFSALYQGQPVPREGGMFKASRINLLDSIDPREIVRSIRYWDKAATQGAGCNSAGVLMHEMRDHTIVIADVVAGQWSALERERHIKRTALIDGKRVKIWCEQEPGSGGKESAEATIRLLAGFVIKADRVTGSKEARAEPFAAQVEGGNVFCLIREWTKQYLDELALFPAAKFRDRVDASTGAFNKLFFKRITPHAGTIPRPEEIARPDTDAIKDLLALAKSPEEREELLNILAEFEKKGAPDGTATPVGA